MKQTHDDNLTDDAETPITVEFDFTAGYAGRWYGPPEDCDPGYGAEVHITGAWENLAGGRRGQAVELPAADRDRIEGWLSENFEPPGRDPDAAREDRWERDRDRAAGLDW